MQFARCAESALAGPLNQPAQTNFNGQLDPQGFRDPQDADRTDCNRYYERQLKMCASLPSATPAATPIPGAKPGSEKQAP